MKTQFQTLLLDAVVSKRTGVLSGAACTEETLDGSAEPGNKGFSLLLCKGEVVGGEFAARTSTAAVLMLLDAPTIVKVRWFPMREGAVAESAPLMSTQQLQYLIAGPPPTTPVDTASAAARSALFEVVERHATEVFQRFFGDNAEYRVARIVSGLGPTATAQDLAKACIKTVEPLLGEGMARTYFQQFL
jgi:hypothetical protein